jgi:hypothetical protein
MVLWWQQTHVPVERKPNLFFHTLARVSGVILSQSPSPDTPRGAGRGALRGLTPGCAAPGFLVGGIPWRRFGIYESMNLKL